MENPRYPIGNQTRDHPPCGAVPSPRRGFRLVEDTFYVFSTVHFHISKNKTPTRMYNIIFKIKHKLHIAPRPHGNKYWLHTCTEWSKSELNHLVVTFNEIRRVRQGRQVDGWLPGWLHMLSPTRILPAWFVYELQKRVKCPGFICIYHMTSPTRLTIPNMETG
jgi:hypothetical protein